MSHIYKKNCFLYHDEGLRKVQCITMDYTQPIQSRRNKTEVKVSGSNIIVKNISGKIQKVSSGMHVA